MGRGIRRRIRRDVIQTSGAETPHCPVGHGLAPDHCALILEIEQGVRFGRSVKSLCVESYRAGQRTDNDRRDGGEIPILETRPSSSALRLRKPAGLAAMHLAVGIMLVCN